MNYLDPANLSIGYISIQDPNDRRSWSGTHYHIFRSLKKYFPNTHALGPARWPLYQVVIEKIYDWISGKLFPKYNSDYALFKMRFDATYFEKQIKKGNYDILFCSVCSTALAKLKTDLPVVYLSDATFSALQDYYIEYTGLPRFSAYEGNFAEEMSIKRANLILYSSEWAKKHAIEDYAASPDKIEVFPYGANILDDPGDEPATNKSNDPRDTCRLLFLAREWQRKGGEVVLETVNELINKGFSIELFVVGCGPKELEDKEHIRVYTFLDKNIKQDYDKFEHIISTCHYLFLPTLADCTPMVFAEANAYGMPVITRDTGGVSTIVKDQVNGYVLPENATATDYAQLIEKVFFNSNGYADMAKQSRDYYRNNLTWNVWASKARDTILNAFCSDEHRIPNRGN